MLGRMSFSARERERLGQLLLDVGPDAPTLCEGWNTRDLAIHLYIRENKPHRASGYLVPQLEAVLDPEIRRQAERPYADVVKAWAAGPPAFIKPVDTAMNTAEHFIHHEDVRRGDGTARPREFSAAVDKTLLGYAKRFAQMSLRSVDCPVILTPPTLPPETVGGRRGVAKKGDNVLRVFGEPGELLLWVTGRDAAQVTIEGDASVLDGVDIKS